MMGMRWMDTRQLVAYNHMFINLQSYCLILLMCPDWYALYNPRVVDFPTALDAVYFPLSQ